MKIVVIGGTGLIGSNVVAGLAQQGHDAVAAAPNTGVNTITGEGLDAAMAGADVVVDVSNSPSFADEDVMNFFVTSTDNIRRAAAKAGTGHYVALSIVGVDRSPDMGYYRAKVSQENMIKESGIPFSIVRSTQFFEFAGGAADSSMVDGVVRLPHVWVQPIAASEVSAIVARTAGAAPTNATHEIAGPAALELDEWVRTVLSARQDPRDVVADPQALFFGGVPKSDALLPGPDAELATTTLAEWLAKDTRR
ncbi:MAG: SDR family oxidoreductase [Marmoricola sp.]